MSVWSHLPPAGPIEAGLLIARNGRGPLQFEGWETWDESAEAKEAFQRGVRWAVEHPLTGSTTPAMADARATAPFTVRALDAWTWNAFAELVERNNGVFGGWCMNHHSDGAQEGLDNRAAKEKLVRSGQAHAALVFDTSGLAQGWAQYGSPDELPRFCHRRAYEQDAPPRPDWRIACFYVDKRHRGQGIARTALEGALDQIRRAGGGLVEAIPEVTVGRTAQSRFLRCATVELFEQHGFQRVRQVGKHAWIVSRVLEPA